MRTMRTIRTLRSRGLLTGLAGVVTGGVLLAAGALAAGAGSQGVSAGANGASAAGSAPTREAGLAAFATIREVLQHPRCQNCHIPGDAPLQFDAGTPHTQNVLRGPDGRGVPGLPCTTCHGAKNPPASYGEHMPPGAPLWRLPGPQEKMVFIGRSPAELCASIKDPKHNGNRTLAALREHMVHDRLVLWGWDPGLGREPVSVPQPIFAAAVDTWLAAGAPCP